MADFDANSVNKQNRVIVIQPAILPLLHILEDTIGDGDHKRGTDFCMIQIRQKL